jgi:hypothetical protein
MSDDEEKNTKLEQLRRENAARWEKLRRLQSQHRQTDALDMRAELAREYEQYATISQPNFDPDPRAFLREVVETHDELVHARAILVQRLQHETRRLAFTKALLDELRSIVSEGEQVSSHFVLSLMEQREDKAAVAFLLETASHPNADIADRALFALEAVACKVFNDRTEAAAWASTWQPEEDRVRLFAPNQAQANDDFTPGVPRDVSPVRKEPSNQVPDQ